MSVQRGGQGCGLGAAPADEAARLVMLAHEARLLEFAVDINGSGDTVRAIADQVELALEQALDADDGPEVEAARVAVDAALAATHRAGYTVSASISVMEVDGILGASKMPVLTAVLAPLPPQATGA